ncbi:prephenate dehydrogenase/arogenate dehydrogenase family protein [Methanothrix sp.]|uniref:prephenate dehydrogenase/arogenate dehydrogenase family protein n=1 Tax=Methanothrix sp. TaxID=90426 RepID=UPI003C77897B
MGRMLIVGGTGETGSWFSRYFRDHGFDVCIWGPSGKFHVADALGVRYAHDLMSEVERSDIVVLSVPIDRTPEVARRIGPAMKSGSLLMDLTSLKVEPVRAMVESTPPDIEVLGAHPMFGPTMPSVRGQTVIITPVEGRWGRWSSHVREILERDGARVEVLTPEEHDRMMAVVQALTHFSYIAIGSTLRALNFDVSRSRRFMSPVYEVMLDFVGRILDQNPELYASIQMNPFAKDVRRAFIEECIRLSDSIERGDVEGFRRAMREAAEHFGDTHSALQRSDRIINQRARERK